MPPSRFLSMTSLVAAGSISGSIVGSGGCGDDRCGPGGAPDIGLIAESSAVALTYGDLTGSPNNDCPAADAPAGVISLTIEGTQLEGEGRITLCVGRPDLLDERALTLGVDDRAQVRVVDLAGTSNGCTFTIDRTQPPSGTAHASGLCGHGSEGFALVVDGALSLTRTCGATVDATPVLLHGRVAVAGPPES